MSTERFFRKPLSELRALQNRRLRHYLSTHIYPFHPHYRALFDRHGIKPHHIRCVQDLKIIPLTSKQDFLKADGSGTKSLDFTLQPSEDLIKTHWSFAQKMGLVWKCCTHPRLSMRTLLNREYRPIFLTGTTGTTNESVSFLYSQYDLDQLEITGARLMEVFQVTPEQRGLNLFPYAPHLAFWQTYYAGIGCGAFVMSTGGGKTVGTEGNIQMLAKIKPQLILGAPSYIYHVLGTALAEKRNIESIQTVVLGAARVLPGFKRKLQTILEALGSHGTKIIGTYGFTEAKTAWGECPTDIHISSGYHTYPDLEIFEVINPETGEVLPEGSDGELVYTSLDARGTCVLRYRTYDFVKGGICMDPCPHCGMTVPRISSDITRTTSVQSLHLAKVKNTLLNFDHLEQLIEDVEEVEEFYIEVCHKNDDPYAVEELHLFVSLKNTGQKQDVEALKQTINHKVTCALEVCFNQVCILSEKEMSSRLNIDNVVKVKRVIDRRVHA